MHLRTAVAECLEYIQKSAPPFDEALLQASLQLPVPLGSDWKSLLDSAPSALVLRSAALHPFAHFLAAADFYEHDLEAGIAAFQDARRHLNAARRSTIRHLDLEAELNRPSAFMIVETAYSLSDGAAHAASQGYFDENNIPPWDTWVKVVPPRNARELGPGLLCWVPAWARGHVELGIALNPEECLHWAEIHDDQVLWR